MTLLSTNIENYLVPDSRIIDGAREAQVRELLDQSGLNWAVEKEQLLLPDGGMTPFLGLVNQQSRECYSTVSDSYEIIQNRQVMDLVQLITETTDSKVEKVNVFNNGASYSISITGREFQISTPKVGDVVGEKIMIANSFDKSSALKIAFGHVTLSCTNGMTRFDKKGSISIRHSANAVKAYKEAMGGLVKKVLPESSKMIEKYHRMAEKTVEIGVVKKALEIVTGFDLNQPWGEMSTRGQNIVLAARNSMESEIANKGLTAWGVLSGVTHYTTSLIGRSDNRDTVLKSKTFGGNAKKDYTAWEFLSNLV